MLWQVASGLPGRLISCFGFVVQPKAVYVLPELILASPGEPWDASQPSVHNAPPIRVPLLPTDTEEQQTTLNWLQSLHVPLETIMGEPPWPM